MRHINGISRRHVRRRWRRTIAHAAINALPFVATAYVLAIPMTGTVAGFLMRAAVAAPLYWLGIISDETAQAVAFWHL